MIPEAAPEDPLLQQRSYVETSVWGPLVDRVPLVALAFFFRQGATMLEAGVPIVQTMATLARQTRDTKLQRIISELGDHVEAGRPLSFGMQRYPEVFSAIMVSLTRAGRRADFSMRRSPRSRTTWIGRSSFGISTSASRSIPNCRLGPAC